MSSAPDEPVVISSSLQRTVDTSGSEAAAWLARLPETLEEVCSAWKVRVERQLHHAGHCSVAFHVRTGGGRSAVLKLSLPDEAARFEGAALRRWEGNGAVRLLDASDDGFALLLERCVGERELCAVGAKEQIEVIVDLLPRLWLPPRASDPFPELADTVARWLPAFAEKARTLGVPGPVAADARLWAQQLDDGAPRYVLHGDLHPGNVLAADREPWLAIDPKPWIGDPAFDLAQLFLNWVWDADTTVDVERELRRRAEVLADRLDLSVQRVLRWATVKALGWESGRDGVLALHAAARAA